MARAVSGMVILVTALLACTNGSRAQAQSPAQNPGQQPTANQPAAPDAGVEKTGGANTTGEIPAPVSEQLKSEGKQPKAEGKTTRVIVEHLKSEDEKSNIEVEASDKKSGSDRLQPAPTGGVFSGINTSLPSATTTSSITLDNNHKRLAQAGSPLIIRSQAFVVPPMLVDSRLRQQQHHGLRGWLAKLFSPIIGPLANGLEDTAYSLHATTNSLYSLQPSLNNLALPLNELAEPLSGLSQPLTGLSQPMVGLQKPISNLSQPIAGLQQPVSALGRSAASLSQPMNGLSKNINGLQQPLSGISQPLLEIRQPLKDLPRPLHELVHPLEGLVSPLEGLQSPLNGVSGGLNGLQGEMHELRLQIEVLQQSILDIGRNVTLAIVFGSCVIAYAIWTHRKVPSVTAPTVSTVDGDLTGSHPGRQTIVTQAADESGEPLMPPHGSAHHQPPEPPPDSGEPPSEPPTNTFRRPLE